MKLLVLSDLWVPFPGGAERLIYNLTRPLLSGVLDVVVYTGYEHAQTLAGPRPRYANVPENRNGARELRRIILDESPDVILTHHYWALTFEDEISKAAREVAAPIVQVVLNGRRLASASMAVYISEYVRDHIDNASTERQRERANDMVIYPPAFPDVETYAVTHDHAIGFVKPIEHKGVDLVYAIAERMPDERFVILRGEWQHIEKIRDDLPNVEYLEPVAMMSEFYERVDRVIVPSLSEDAGTIAQECTVNGIPCISSRVGGLVETNAGGWLTEGHDVDEWVEAIESLYSVGVISALVSSMRRLNPTTQNETLLAFVERVYHLAGA